MSRVLGFFFAVFFPVVSFFGGGLFLHTLPNAMHASKHNTHTYTYTYIHVYRMQQAPVGWGAVEFRFASLD